MSKSAFLLCLGLCAAAPARAHEVYVSSEKDNAISVIDTKTLEVVRTFPVGKRPRGITFANDFSQFYVCASDSNAVQVYDAQGATHLHDLPSGEDPEQFAVSPDGKRLFIDNLFDDQTGREVDDRCYGIVFVGKDRKSVV